LGALALTSAAITTLLSLRSRATPAAATDADVLALLQVLHSAGGTIDEGDALLAGRGPAIATAVARRLASDGSGWAAHLVLTPEGEAHLAAHRA
jgi:hypothetical protein